MIFRRKQKASDLAAAVSELEQAVAARDGARTERAFKTATSSLQSTTETECIAVGPRLAALLPAFPPTGPRPMLATAAGFCVERGADPAACAEPILDGTHQDLLDALEFARLWTATGGPEDELPEPDTEVIDDALTARLGDEAHEALRLALAWCSVEEWQPPALAVLCRSAEVRRRYASALLPACRDLAALERHDLMCLAYALAILDDEPLVVLHRPTGPGSRCASAASGTTSSCTRCSPTFSSAADTCPAPHRRRRASVWPRTPNRPRGRTGIVSTGAFELLAPDGERIWNEGLPDDIPVVEGRRLLVLDEPAYPRSWNADRFFPMLPGTVEVARVLSADETQTRFACTSSGKGTRRTS
ncbi:hypothetical protein [Streptomyces sp. NPDC002172]